MSGDVVILFVSGIDADDRPIYAYVALKAENVEPFMAARNSGDFRPDEFGIVLASGEGEPRDDVQARIAAEWDFDPETENMPSVFDAAEVHRLAVQS